MGSGVRNREYGVAVMPTADSDRESSADLDAEARRPGSDRSPARVIIDAWDPLYFALVMATGIVSIATWLLGHREIGLALFGINVVAYGVVGVLTLARVALDWRGTVGDLFDHDRAFGSFTAIAGTCVLGSQFVVLEISPAAASGLLAVGGILWLLLTYAVAAALTIRDVEVPIDEAIDGSWFLLVVATQSVAVLAGLLAPEYPSMDQWLLFAGVSLYSIGGMFYLILITLVFYRLTFFPFDPESASPPYWINMGAVAITTLAGSVLLLKSGGWSFLADLRPFLTGFTFFFWATATWWIPLLLVLGAWRHAYGGIALPHTVDGYDPRYWGMVFPLGMYTACTVRFADATGLELIRIVPEYFVAVALLAWVVVAIGLLRRISQYTVRSAVNGT